MAKKTAEYQVSVIMPSFHTGPILVRALQAALSQKHLDKLILVDNGNSDYVRGKIEEFVSKYDKLHVISGQGNIGFARACNLGEHEATGNHLLLLNPGCILPPGTFTKAIKSLESTPSAWIAGCKLVNTDRTEQKGNRRNLLTFKNMVSEWFKLYKYFYIPRVELSSNKIHEGNSFVPSISSAFMMMKRDKYQEIGGVDKKYFSHVEDLDICFQVNQMGGRIIFISDLEVVRYSNKSDVPNRALDKYKAKGLVYYFKKNFDGAYFPGAITLISALIYLRLIFQLALSAIKDIKKILSKPLLKPDDLNKYVSFVEKYKNFEVEPKKDIRNHRYYINNRSPILITDCENQTGICILRRLLAANVDIIALYNNKPIDLYHPKLTWVQSQLGTQAIDLPKNTKLKTVICTSSIQYLSPHIEKFASLGTTRLIAFTPLQNSNKNSDILDKKQSIAEQDISRICTQKKIQYTVLRTPMVYGLGFNNCVGSAYKFIKRFNMFPTGESGFNIYSPVHADDLAISALKILNIEETYGRSYNLLGNDRQITYQDLLDKIFKASNKKTRLSKSPVMLLFFKAYTKITGRENANIEAKKYKEENLNINSENAKKDFGYKSNAFLTATSEDLGLDSV